MRFVLSAVLGAVLVASATVAMAQESGIAVKVKQAADVNRASGQLMLREQAPVFMGDVIKTGPVGEAQIRLADDTRLVVGPNSLMTIDRFVFEGSNTASQVSLNAVRGAFRFITGSSRKDAYTINTPTATIGLRGTQLDFSVGDWGTAMAVFGNGAADYCRRDVFNICERDISGCDVVVRLPTQELQRLIEGQEHIDALVSLFPFVVDQHLLESEFQIDTAECDIPDSAIRQALRARLGPPDPDDDDEEDVEEGPPPEPDDEEEPPPPPPPPAP